jgi:ribosomal protein S18 acetylase RimI-like enzyme
MSDSEICIAALPRSLESKQDWDELVALSKNFRLKSLQLSARSFGSTYEREVQFDTKQWEDRLTNPKATSFIAVEVDHPTTQTQDMVICPDRLWKKKWVGFLVLVGPSIDGTTNVQTDDGPVTVDLPKNPSLGELIAQWGIGGSPHYIVNAVYVMPESRRMGIGKKLIEGCITHMKNDAEKRGAKAVKFTLRVDYENEAARTLYEKCGFSIVKRYFFEDRRAPKNADGTLGVTEAAEMELIAKLDLNTASNG